jgi:hypothetical protein
LCTHILGIAFSVVVAVGYCNQCCC